MCSSPSFSRVPPSSRKTTPSKSLAFHLALARSLWLSFFARAQMLFLLSLHFSICLFQKQCMLSFLRLSLSFSRSFTFRLPLHLWIAIITGVIVCDAVVVVDVYFVWQRARFIPQFSTRVRIYLYVTCINSYMYICFMLCVMRADIYFVYDL